MPGTFSLALDVVLIALLGAGIYFAVRLSRQMASLRTNRADMERFVMNFSATVQRAEAGIQGLRLAARTGGDDLEKLIDKAQALRDELHFLVDSADKIASRLSDTASTATRLTAVPEPVRQAGLSGAAKPAILATPRSAASADPLAGAEKAASTLSSAAERELLKVLEKLR